MNKKRLIIVLLIMAVITPLWSSMDTELLVLGFSADGSYIAYQVSGIESGSAIAFSTIQIVDVEANDFATEGVYAEKFDELKTLKESVLAEAGPLMKKYGIVQQNTGILAYQLPDDRSWEQISRFEKTTELSLTDPLGETFNYRILLKEREVDSDDCSELAFFDQKPRIFSISIQGNGFDKILQKDRVLYKSRKCPHNYDIFQVYVYGNRIAIFLHSRTQGWEGYNVHKLIVTGLLDRTFPIE